MADREAAVVRDEALEALKLHDAGNHAEALARAVALTGAHPGSALAHNLVGYLHKQAGVAAWNNRALDDEQAASEYAASLKAFSAAATLAPNCIITALAHAEALAACHRHGDAQKELLRALAVTDTDHDDPTLHNVWVESSDLSCCDTDKTAKKKTVMDSFTKTICQEILPREATELLDPKQLRGTAAAATRDKARILSHSYPYSARAQLLDAYIDLAQARASYLPSCKKQLLWHTLRRISSAAAIFDASLVIALFRAKLLFVLDEFDAAESECLRALRIDTPNDPSDEAIPPLFVRGEDYNARVLSMKKQLHVLLKQITVGAAAYWCSMTTTQQQENIRSVRVDELQEHYQRIDKFAAKTVSDVQHFVRRHNAWRFWMCPHPSCHGKKFLSSHSLWQHMCCNHQVDNWEKLQSVLGTEPCTNSLKEDHLIDGVTLGEDALHQHDVFRLPRLQDVFESVICWSTIGMEAESVAGMQQRKCNEAFQILEAIKKKLKMLPEETSSTEFRDCCLEIQAMLLKFVEVSVIDYRQVILPLAGSFRLREIKRDIAHAVNYPGKTIGDAKIDAVFSSISSQANRTDHQNGDSRQIRNLEALHKEEEMLKADTKCEDGMNRTAGLADLELSFLSWTGCSKSQGTKSEVIDGEEPSSYKRVLDPLMFGGSQVYNACTWRVNGPRNLICESYKECMGNIMMWNFLKGKQLDISKLLGEDCFLSTTAIEGTFYLTLEYYDADDDEIYRVTVPIDGREGWTYGIINDHGRFEYHHTLMRYMTAENEMMLDFDGDYANLSPDGIHTNMELGVPPIQWAIKVAAKHRPGHPTSRELQIACGIIVNYACEGYKQNPSMKLNCDSLISEGNIFMDRVVSRKNKRWMKFAEGSLHCFLMRLKYPADLYEAKFPPTEDVVTAEDAMRCLSIYPYNAIPRPVWETRKRTWKCFPMDRGTEEAGGQPHYLSSIFTQRWQYNKQLLRDIPSENFINVDAAVENLNLHRLRVRRVLPTPIRPFSATIKKKFLHRLPSVIRKLR